ncbi:hypothetical protein ACTXT7_011037 [Hymenolepis weldensis]
MEEAEEQEKENIRFQFKLNSARWACVARSCKEKRGKKFTHIQLHRHIRKAEKRKSYTSYFTGKMICRVLFIV